MLLRCPKRLNASRPPQPKISPTHSRSLRFQGRKRVHNADKLMSAIVAKRLVEHLERSGFVKRPPIGCARPRS